MPRYELDDYVREHGADDAVNASCVVSWRAHAGADGRVESLFVSLHNSWYCDWRHWNGRAEAPGRLWRALQRNERGRCGNSRIA